MLNDTAEIITSLVRVATVISPSHGKAVALAMMDYVHLSPDDEEFAVVVSDLSFALVAEIAHSAFAMEQNGAEVIMTPFLPNSNSSVSTAQRLYRENMVGIIGNMEYRDGRFHSVRDRGDFFP